MSQAGQNCSSNCESLLRTFPTRLLTGQARISSAGKGRSKSTGDRVQIILDRILAQERKLQFSIVEEGIPLTAKKPPRRAQ